MSRPPTRRQSVVKDKAKFVGMPTRLCLGSLTHNTSRGAQKNGRKDWGSASKASKAGRGEGKGGGPAVVVRGWLPCPCPVSLVRCRASSPSSSAPPPAHPSKAGQARALVRCCREPRACHAEFLLLPGGEPLLHEACGWG